ncbi:hypothetical protein ABZ863_30625 [Saccharomonospora sp. NPDC046836]|uniref:hypothetical protein n=1 Tax=Saccharomonospora sp. NPDC046836 TaxID=3156921 RepID=UPI0033EC23DA
MVPPPRSDFSRITVDARFRQWRTTSCERTVLVVARTTTALTRLLDVLSLMEADQRVQIVFTHDPASPAIFSAGLDEAMDSLRAPVVPWSKAIRTRFDLAIAASENDHLHQLAAPVLLLPHGLGFQKYYPGSRTVAGMNPQRLLHRGQPVLSAIALSHSDQYRQLADSCPEASSTGVVVGDPCLDRMLASGHMARRYRETLGATDRTLILLASTWGPDSLFGLHPTLPERLLAELPVDEYRVAMSLHAGVWAHGPWQVRAWLSRAREAGLVLLPAHEDWRAAVLAADLVVSDRGSLSLYAAATDTPVLLTRENSATTVPGSPMASLTAQAPHLDTRGDLRAQLDSAVHTHTPWAYAAITKQAVDNPGHCARPLRALLYELLQLTEPDRSPEFPTLPAPGPEHAGIHALFVGATMHADGSTSLERLPARPVDKDWSYPHLVAEAEHARLSEVSAASVVFLPDAPDFPAHAAEALRQWPHALLAAAARGRSCQLLIRDGTTAALTMSGGVDPRLAASLAYVRLQQVGRIPDTDTFRLGERVIDVRSVAPAHPDTGTSADD